jgi:AAA+ ATPase superfamily predicted ATPase
MLIPLKIKENASFAGRGTEQATLKKLAHRKHASIIVVYGRRRVGKTELIEQTLRKEPLLKFEGLERQGRRAQLDNFARTMAYYLERDEKITPHFTSWLDAFETLARFVKTGRWIIYLEELQWLANYQNELISSFKHVWDNQLRHNPKLTVIFCGSAPSFMINKVLKSSALYNRTEEQLPVRPLSLAAVQHFMGRSRNLFEVMDAVLTVGAVPPYLQKLKEAPSILIGLAHNSFRADGYFVQEYERIFTSSMSDNPSYKRILEFLASLPFASKQQIAAHLKKNAGGGLTNILEDLEQSAFISSYSPLDKNSESKTKRYQIIDPYIRFFLQFIKPVLGRIQKGQYEKVPEQAFNTTQWRTFLGLSFERWIRANSSHIAYLLGFSGVGYDAGAYFSRSLPKAQIDLVFEREDKVTTIIETKYTSEPVGKEVIAPFERACKIYPAKNRRVQKILISATGANSALIQAGYFDRILSLEDLV